MHIKTNNTRFFFQNEMVNSVKVGDVIQRIFRHRETALAEKTATSVGALLATGFSGSVLRTASEHLGESRSYTPYGHERSILSSSHKIAFNGELHDSFTKSYALGNGHRLFSPTIMRFFSPDYLSPFYRGGINSYCYCLGDPLNSTDPTGQSLIPLSWRSQSSILKNSTKRLSHYRTKISQTRNFVLYPDGEKTVLQSGLGERYKQNQKTLEKLIAHENKHTDRITSVGASVPALTHQQKYLERRYAENMPGSNTYRAPAPAPASKTKLSKSERILDASGLTLAEKLRYDEQAPLKISASLLSDSKARDLSTTAAALRS